MNRKEKPKTEFSKKIFNIVITLFIIVIFFSMILMWRTGDVSPLYYLIPSVGGLAATSVGFYYHKAQVENRIKLSKEYKILEEELKNIENEEQYTINNYGGN